MAKRRMHPRAPEACHALGAGGANGTTREATARSLTRPPPKKKLIILKVSPNISKSRLILYLEENGKLGVIINAPELDMVQGL
ncbi:MAG: hypothetical protein RSO15_15230 [Bacteroides sp.]|uniref:hypothetical protein n=1 Tax=Bacteroides sp. TaxID=29523 RepID=UPI002FC996C4